MYIVQHPTPTFHDSKPLQLTIWPNTSPGFHRAEAELTTVRQGIQVRANMMPAMPALTTSRLSPKRLAISVRARLASRAARCSLNIVLHG
jgi:hypothetical protein